MSVKVGREKKERKERKKRKEEKEKKKKQGEMASGEHLGTRANCCVYFRVEADKTMPREHFVLALLR
jgi:hypothetical protein